MTGLPLTRVPAAPEKEAAIGSAVRAVSFPPQAPQQLAGVGHAGAFFDLVADPRVSGPIYTLPRPVTLQGCRAFIADRIERRARGEGFLLLMLDRNGVVAGYQDIEIWPQWAAADVGGAIRLDAQGTGAGRLGASRAFNWLFETIGVDLICETAALDNVRSQKIMERAGFRYVGVIESELPGGGSRPSHYWELTRAEWAARRG
jgi:RimJ/RimL family protein N-acetyltransferase